MIVVLMLAIPFGWAFLWLARQQSRKDRSMVHYPDLLLGDTPQYVPPQESAEQYYSQVRQDSQQENPKIAT